jgi:hypothetical protein
VYHYFTAEYKLSSQLISSYLTEISLCVVYRYFC